MVDQNGFHLKAVRSAQIRWVDKMLVTIARQICRASLPKYSDDDGVAMPISGVDFASRAIFRWHNFLLDLDSQHQTIRPLRSRK